MVKQSAMSSMGRIIDAFTSSGYLISQLRLHEGELAISVTGDMSSGDFPKLLERINAQLGPTSVELNSEDVFSAPQPPVRMIEASSLLLIRPHAVKAGHLGRMIDQVIIV